jgi:hypothetical protein
MVRDNRRIAIPADGNVIQQSVIWFVLAHGYSILLRLLIFSQRDGCGGGYEDFINSRSMN